MAASAGKAALLLQLAKLHYCCCIELLLLLRLPLVRLLYLLVELLLSLQPCPHPQLSTPTSSEQQP
jgi:hypothetical protein